MTKEEEIKILSFVGLITASIIGLSAIVSKCHNLYERAKENKEKNHGRF